jgi:hypothetical protein
MSAGMAIVTMTATAIGITTSGCTITRMIATRITTITVRRIMTNVDLTASRQMA